MLSRRGRGDRWELQDEGKRAEAGRVYGTRAPGAIPSGLVVRSGSAGRSAIVPLSLRAPHSGEGAVAPAVPCAPRSPHQTNSKAASEPTIRKAPLSLWRTTPAQTVVEEQVQPSSPRHDEVLPLRRRAAVLAVVRAALLPRRHHRP